LFQKNNSKFKKTLTLASLTLLGSNFVVMYASAAVAKEKCYGVVKAGQNDCATKKIAK
jgi:uncharacterized membrane protein